MASIPLRVSAHMASLAQVFEALDQLQLSEPAPQDAFIDMRVALDEIFSNIVRHAFDGGEHEVDVVLTRAAGSLEAIVEDDGKPFDPTAAPPPALAGDAQERELGGLGIHLVRQITSEVAYLRSGPRNVLRLARRFEE